jgi:hypothetical protein
MPLGWLGESDWAKVRNVDQDGLIAGSDGYLRARVVKMVACSGERADDRKASFSGVLKQHGSLGWNSPG